MYYVCMNISMYVCMYVLYAYIRVCVHLCVYAFMYICMHVCIHVCIYVIFKLGFERCTGGIVLVGRGNCPGELSGEIVRGNCPRKGNVSSPSWSAFFRSPSSHACRPIIVHIVSNSVHCHSFYTS